MICLVGNMHPSTLLFFYHICIHLNLYCHAYQGKWQAIEIVMAVLSAYKIRQLNVVMDFNHNKTICIYNQYKYNQHILAKGL